MTCSLNVTEMESKHEFVVGLGVGGSIPHSRGSGPVPSPAPLWGAFATRTFDTPWYNEEEGETVS
jgi:hypothetical protein